MQDYLQGLNDRQREAVLHIKGPLMIVAGAGSGKTKVLTTRIAHLMRSGVDAFNILALTFTNKAAKEMKERIEKILGNSEARNLYVGTFHSVFARILRSEAHLMGYPNNFTIYDTDDAKSVVKTVINEMNLDDKTYKPSTVYNRISSAKNALVGPVEYANDYAIQQEDLRGNRPAMAQIYDAYVKRCFKNGAMDFDDLLLKFYELLKNFPESLSKYQRKFKYILVDEYQDTNPAQYEVIKLLGAMNENVCVVGDDAQSIYSFRGATIQNILQFQKDYEDAKVVMLEQNYRSSKAIIAVANEIIANNKGQIPKALWTDNNEGEKIRLVRTMTDNEEGKYVADTIQEQKLRNHYNNKDFAILYRTNAQSRAFEEALRRMNIPYTMFGGTSFYTRKEIKDFVAYLRIIVNPRDEEALKRIINYPARGIGKTTVDKTVLFANQNNVTMWEVLERAREAGFKAGTLEAIEEFVTMIKSFASMLKSKNAYEVAVHVGKQTNIVKELFNDKSTEGVARYENIQELLNSIKEWVDTQTTLSQIDEEGTMLETSENDAAGSGEITLGAYLQQITLLTDADDKDPNADTVKLMTIHAAKGLEFGCVFAAGLEEMLFPNGMAVNTREELEEERRLFYVVITRARQRLWITYANTRYRFGQLVQNEPSRFIEELPGNYLDRSYAGGGFRNQGLSTRSNQGSFDRSGNGGGWGAGGNKQSAAQAEKRYGAPPSKKPAVPSYVTPKPQPKAVEHVPSADFVASDTSNLQEGQKVEHQKFGFGVVSKVEGSAHNPVATVKFEQNGEKKIMLNYAKLRIIE
ncbi:UvrD-helicase domain-containing protein [Paraflavitalea sp. CAU 1676]|uniref:ATP-dependent helicase n=1 Tax=Paraflavitalea sp. CAU 1676 TaxID=3032598 RepID=UPI0023DBA8B1|nr:UvrD-helicase domain-containing protein [Paraflavitalea sp. CAU 1676]MDF2191099.1 3'-5' exonuclease [Paraflavitalea sp. CAU 1676]